MSILREFIVRYRTEGHVRFQVPTRLCEPTVAAALTNQLTQIPGIYRVNFYYTQGKLSIRFNEHQCSFKHLAIQMATLLKTFEQTEERAQKTSPSVVTPAPKLLATVGHKVNQLKASQWFKEKYNDAKETLQAAKAITKLSLKKPNRFVRDPEKAFIDFLNDILVLYLIKLHWKRIISFWIPNPFKYRYEWLTVFYLFYLLIRSRRPIQ